MDKYDERAERQHFLRLLNRMQDAAESLYDRDYSTHRRAVLEFVGQLLERAEKAERERDEARAQLAKEKQAADDALDPTGWGGHLK